MEKSKKGITDRVTTDAVHRRFLDANKSKSKDNKENGNYYFCGQCKQSIRASSGKEELKGHFDSVQHNPSGICVHCSEPVYNYNYKEKLEVYHVCR